MRRRARDRVRPWSCSWDATPWPTASVVPRALARRVSRAGSRPEWLADAGLEPVTRRELTGDLTAADAGAVGSGVGTIGSGSPGADQAARPDPGDLDARAGLHGLDHLPRPHVHGHVADGVALSVEEQVTGLEVRQRARAPTRRTGRRRNATARRPASPTPTWSGPSSRTRPPVWPPPTRRARRSATPPPPRRSAPPPPGTGGTATMSARAEGRRAVVCAATGLAATRAWKAAAWAAACAACCCATSVAMWPLRFESVDCWLASSCSALLGAPCAAVERGVRLGLRRLQRALLRAELALGLVQPVDRPRDAVARHLLVLLRGGRGSFRSARTAARARLFELPEV